MVKIHIYKGDKKVLVKLIEELQDYLVDLDSLKRLRRLPEYGEIYIDKLLENNDTPRSKLTRYLVQLVKEMDFPLFPKQASGN